MQYSSWPMKTPHHNLKYMKITQTLNIPLPRYPNHSRKKLKIVFLHRRRSPITCNTDLEGLGNATTIHLQSDEIFSMLHHFEKMSISVKVENWNFGDAGISLDGPKDRVCIACMGKYDNQSYSFRFVFGCLILEPLVVLIIASLPIFFLLSKHLNEWFSNGLGITRINHHFHMNMVEQP